MIGTPESMVSRFVLVGYSASGRLLEMCPIPNLEVGYEHVFVITFSLINKMASFIIRVPYEYLHYDKALGVIK